MKGVCCSLPIQLIGVNKFQTLSAINESALISLKYRDNKIYWCIIKNEEPIFMSSSEIKDIKISDDYSDLIVIGYRAEEIAANIKVKKFIEQDGASTKDLLEYSRKIESLDKFPPKPLYLSQGQSLFSKYQGPNILDNPLDAR
jgi:tRNA A37 threonylcarbamoyladenosine modification protein TsaB